MYSGAIACHGVENQNGTGRQVRYQNPSTPWVMRSDRPLRPWVSVEDASGDPVQSISVIKAPVDELIKKRPEWLLWICNNLVIFHLFQYFFHRASVNIHDNRSLCMLTCLSIQWRKACIDNIASRLSLKWSRSTPLQLRIDQCSRRRDSEKPELSRGAAL